MKCAVGCRWHGVTGLMEFSGNICSSRFPCQFLRTGSALSASVDLGLSCFLLYLNPSNFFVLLKDVTIFNASNVTTSL